MGMGISRRMGDMMNSWVILLGLPLEMIRFYMPNKAIHNKISTPGMRILPNLPTTISTFHNSRLILL